MVDRLSGAADPLAEATPDRTDGIPINKVRSAIDALLTQELSVICDHIMTITRQSVNASALPHRGQVLASVARIVQRILERDDRYLAHTMLRYTQEGEADTYSDNPSPLLALLRQHGYLGDEDCGLLDLGSGRGDMVNAWEATGRPALGIDLSPTFVLKNPSLRHGLIDADYTGLVEAVGDHKPGLVLTSMTADRVQNPSELLANVINLARLYKSNFAFVTILPISPIDDDATSNPITYTDDRQRLTAGRNADEDEGVILEFLAKFAPDYDIVVHKNICSIQSSGSTHEYTQYCFCGKPKTK